MRILSDCANVGGRAPHLWARKFGDGALPPGSQAKLADKRIGVDCASPDEIFGGKPSKPMQSIDFQSFRFCLFVMRPGREVAQCGTKDAAIGDCLLDGRDAGARLGSSAGDCHVESRKHAIMPPQLHRGA
jgi:hypothetical protein